LGEDAKGESLGRGSTLMKKKKRGGRPPDPAEPKGERGICSILILGRDQLQQNTQNKRPNLPAKGKRGGKENGGHSDAREEKKGEEKGGKRGSAAFS